ncbi:hypothetical protein Scep_019450 [Stephania cephalantha]|uniref:Uncharacterized protein n=1 Tax=Stephania cephalantha TaxID=152367 RepID=A0AAP0IBT7_9MAGN
MSGRNGGAKEESAAVATAVAVAASRSERRNDGEQILPCYVSDGKGRVPSEEDSAAVATAAAVAASRSERRNDGEQIRAAATEAATAEQRRQRRNRGDQTGGGGCRWCVELDSVVSHTTREVRVVSRTTRETHNYGSDTMLVSEWNTFIV